MVDIRRQLFTSMVNEYQIEPSPEHYSCIVNMLGRAGRLEEAEDLVGQITGQPEFSVLQSLLGACRVYGNVEMGVRIADALVEMERMGLTSYVLMSNLYAEKRQREKVEKIRKEMREREVKKEVGFSWVYASDTVGSLYLHRFSSGDMSHPQSEEIWREKKHLQDNLVEAEPTLEPFNMEI
ncbi:hypothetical protein CJ030_MR6G025944 [Morella rubra]|uniref:Pentatricopeptide repeat-containing protein n=1 Tax=Morella rubra TaxID=262757 RepID=A0A6A1VD76_9ROSI|nr:hypothetical protein CJ030_MR6G025944 [Morella rubra]